MLPLRDDNPTHITPYVTFALIGACVLVFLWQFSLSGAEGARAIFALGAIPAVVFQHAYLSPDLAILPSDLDFLTLISSQFLHGGWMHLLGNMLFLWIFGNNVEDAMGHLRFVFFYLICGTVAALIHAAMDTTSTVPTVGASGAISGVLGAYLLLYPRAKVLVWAFAFFVFRLPAFVVLGFWIVMQVLNFGGGGDENVAWMAHIGGFATGMVLVLAFKYRHVGLFGSGHLAQTARPVPVAVDTEPARPDPPEPGPWGREKAAEKNRDEAPRGRSSIPSAGDKPKE